MDRKQTHSVLWLTGPPGSGKTSLVSSFLVARGLPCLWYQVDKGDRDIATFFYYMGLAAKKAAPHKRQPLPLLTPEYLQDIPAFTRRYFKRLYNRIILSCRYSSGRPKGRFMVVFDNYQEAPEDSSFQEVILQGLSEIPTGITVILISRREPPALFARMRANRLMGTIGWDELKFTAAESKQMLHLRGYRGLSNELLRQLHERTDGWAAGLVLLTEEKARGMDPFASRTHVPEEIFQYFTAEIFNRTDKETQDFLLKTAFFPRMNYPMAEGLTGLSQTRRILSDLSRKNYFTQRHESQTLYYQYHPLFRDFLQAQGRRRFGPDELSQIEQRAAMILAENGQVEDAADLMAKANQWPDLVRLILEHGRGLISQGRNRTLETWIKSLPGPLLSENPWLLYWLGVCRLSFSPLESGTCFERALTSFRAGKEAAGVVLSLSGLFDSTTYGMGDFKAYDRWLDLLKQVEMESKPYSSEEIEARLTASMAFAIIARQPKHPEVRKWIERALFLVERSPDLYVKTRTLQSLASQWIFTGNLSKAARVIDSFQEVAHSPDLSPVLAILLKMLEAMYGWMSGSFEECRKAASRGLDLASSTGIHLWDNFLLGHAAAGALSSGELAEARGLLKRMSSSLDRTPAWGKEYYHALAAWACLVQGDLPGAHSHIELCLAFSAETGMLLTGAFDHLGKALILIELKREKEARGQINRVQVMARSFKAPLIEFTCLLSRAFLEFDQGNGPSGLDSLSKAMALGREYGYINTFFWHAPRIANLCRRALDAGIEVDYVQTLIRKRALFPDPPPYDCARWPWPLKVFALGRFKLEREGSPLDFSGKAPRKMLSLLKVLVASGSRGISEEELTDALWPEAEGDMAHQALATTLHRLRQLLGNEKAIRLREGHLRLDGRACWVDAHAFEQMLERYEASESLPLLEKAVSLYSGLFLEGDHVEPWVISYQERLRSKFLRSVVRLGQILDKNGKREKAIEYYRRGLEVDVLAEELYQRLMLCYQASGRKAEALSVYDRCCETLQSVLGIEPSPYTQEIHDALRR